ncbi:MAG: carboxypeptidase-like regulatory domain-containing protein [bacterium]
MRSGIHLLFAVGTVGIATTASAQQSDCVTVRDAVSKHAIASALVEMDGDAGASREAWSDSLGRACWARDASANARHVRVNALGYVGALREARASDARDVLLERGIGPSAQGKSADEREWRLSQLALAVSLAIRDARSCDALVIAPCASSYGADMAHPSQLTLSDSAASAEARARLASLSMSFLKSIALRLRGGAGQPPELLREPTAITLVTFVDVPDSTDRYTELRVAIPFAAGRALFGATEMICKGADCDRHRQLSFKWDVNEEHLLAPTMIMATDGLKQTVDVFDLSASLSSAALSPVASTMTPDAKRSVMVRGVVRDDKGISISGAQIIATPGDGETRTDSTGHFEFVVHTAASAIVLTARAIGHTPAFRTTSASGDSAINWEPRLKAVQLLSARIVRGVGVPAELASWRYDELLARRAQGRGFFMVGKDISSSSSIGDALSRAPGVTVKMKYSNTILGLSMSKCTQRRISAKFLAPGDRIGVWLNGNEQTLTQAAEAVLGDLLVADVIAMEVYNGATEIPAEYTGANYCGVVSVWTK